MSLFAFVATLNFPLRIILNLVVPFWLVFRKSSQFNQMGYFSGLMTFTFLQLMPVNLHGFLIQTIVMLYGLGCFLIIIPINQRIHPKTPDYLTEQKGLLIFSDWVTRLTQGEENKESAKNLLKCMQTLYQKAYLKRGNREFLAMDGKISNMFALLFQRAVYFMNSHYQAEMIEEEYARDYAKRIVVYIAKAVGCILLSLLFPILPGPIGHIILASVMGLCMYTATPGTWIHTLFSTCYALSMTTIAMEKNTAIELRLLYVVIAILLVLAINKFFFPTSMGRQFRYNFQLIFHMHHVYLRILENSLSSPLDYGVICDAQILESYISYTDYVLNQVQQMLQLKTESDIREIGDMNYKQRIDSEPELSLLMVQYAKNLSRLYQIVCVRMQKRVS